MTGNSKILIVGAGRIGTRWAHIVSRTRGAELAGIVDADAKAAKKLADGLGVSWSTSFAKTPAADACIVAVPHAFLSPIARKALTRNLHVLIEKPGALHERELVGLAALAKAKKRTVTIGYNYRYFDSIQRVKKLVDRGRVGKLLHMRLRHGHAGRKSYGNEWRMDVRLAGGGVLMDQGVHLVDLIHYFFPVEMRAVGATSNRYWHAAAEDNAAGICTNKHGQIASFFVGITEWKPLFSLEIIGTKGFCRVDGLGRKYGGTEVLTVGTRRGESLLEKRIVCNNDADEALRAELREFLAMTNGLSRKRGASVADAARVLHTVQQIYRRQK